MSKSLYKSLRRSSRQIVEETERPWISESAIVTDNNDPERRHRIKVTIPSLDEDNVFDDWISPATPFSKGDGYGSSFIPPIGSEVRITGDLGQKHNWTYHGAVHNEDAAIPEEFGPEADGVKVPGELAYIAELKLRLASLQEDVEILAQHLCKIDAENIESTATETNAITGENVEIAAGQKITFVGNEIETTAEGDLLINGGTVKIDSEGQILIEGSSVKINPSGTLTLFNRNVNKVGPSI